MASVVEDNDDDTLVEQLRLQLSEIDMLQSMFPNHGEFQLDDPSVLHDVNEYVQEHASSKARPPRLDFAIQLLLGDSTIFHVACSLPHTYPSTLPEIFVRSSVLDRNQQHNLNQDLSVYMNTLDRGELCVCSAIQWLQDNISRYITVTANEESQPTQAEQDNSQRFTRYWIYSHHIYNKDKRRTILELAKNLNISGFCLPGKPGIICAEGIATDCDDFWNRVKQMKWKKILCKMKEVVERQNVNIDKFRRFNNFEEIAFEVRKGPGREYHMDMGEFYNYLEKHCSGYVFKNYFGVDGKSDIP